MLRLLGILLTVLFAIACTVITWPQFFQLEQTWPIAQLVSLRGVLVLGFAAILIVSLLLAIARPIRGFAASIAIIALLAAGANAAIVAGRGIQSDALPAKTETALRVMTWNTAGAATPADTIAHAAVAMEADVVTLPETTIETGEQVAIAMREMGRPMWAYHATYEGWDANSTTILITPELGDYSVIESSRDGSSNTSEVPSAVAMPVDGTGPIIVAAHAVAPRQEYMQSWRDDLQWLADQCSADNVIIAGDFNASLDHVAGLGIDGGDVGRCHDAASATGSGGFGTWHTSLPPLLGVPIDHVMATANWKPTGSIVLDSLDTTGSDHRPIVAQFEPAP